MISTEYRLPTTEYQFVTTEPRRSLVGAYLPTALLRRIVASVGVPIIAVLLALLIGAIILLLSGASPLAAYGALLQGAFGSPQTFGRTLEKATPLVFSKTLLITFDKDGTVDDVAYRTTGSR